MWEKLVKGGDAGTLKPTKKHATLKRNTLSALTKRTLGAGNMVTAVKLPDGEEKNDWLAANTVDFFNELSLLYGLVVQSATKKYANPGEGFPPGFEYRWSQPGKKPIRVSSPEYVDYVMTWIEANLDNPSIFPTLEDDPWPDDFESYISDMFRRMFRIFAIIFHRSFDEIEKIDAQAHLNTVFKHFMFFCFEFKLVDEKETAALKGPVQVLQQEWQKNQ